MAVFIGLGANLDHPRWGTPRKTLTRALRRLADAGVQPVRLSGWFRSSPIPASTQPWYVNAVAEVRTGLAPDATLATLHRIEDIFGRARRELNEARWIDLDLLDYQSVARLDATNGPALLPHPKLASRAFVLVPLSELAPQWRHPVSGLAIATLIGRLPAGQQIEPLTD